MGWFDPQVGDGNFSYTPPITPPPVEAPQIDINYAAKKRMADALRQKAMEATKRQGTQFSDTIVSEGVNGAPGQVQVNYGGILANALTPWLNQRGAEQISEDAGAAEDEATAARMEVLKRMNPDMSPQDMMLMGEELGSEGLVNKGMELMTAKPEDFYKQNVQYGDSAMDMRRINALSTMQGRQAPFSAEIIAQQETAEAQDVQNQKDIKAAGRSTSGGGYKPTAEEAKYNLWLSANKGKNYNDYLAATGPKRAGSTGAGGGAGGGRYDPAREALVLSESAKKIRDLIETEGDTMFGAGQSVAAGAREFGGKAGGLMGTAAEMLGTKYESPANASMRALGVDAALESVAKMAPASDTDVQMLLRNKPNAFQSKESALAFVDLMEKVAQRYSIPINGAAPPADETNYDDTEDLVNRYAQ